jgi:hypothetical protein
MTAWLPNISLDAPMSAESLQFSGACICCARQVLFLIHLDSVWLCRYAAPTVHISILTQLGTSSKDKITNVDVSSSMF